MLAELNKDYLSRMYVRHKFASKGIITQETEKSLGFELLTSSLQKLSITSALMTNHKTKKKDQEYNYNFWEFKIPQGNYEFLICVCLENFEGNIKENGFFVFPKSILDKLGEKNTINIFESDISGNYSREPKINKHKYFKNYNQLQEK